MNDLRIWYCDLWPEFLSDENIFTPILSKHFNVILDKVHPDVVFHSIFNGQRDIQNFKNAKRILFIGENHRSSKFETDYSISFDPHSETNFRLPLWQYYLILNPTLKEGLFNHKPSTPVNDGQFCSFVVSNPNNFIRNGFYNQLSQYKFVNSYGRYLTNSYDLQKLSNGRYWREAKNEFFDRTRHKFSICFEHSSHPGYCTEKLMDSFLGASIPIYWGDPNVVEDWNERAFINVTKMGTQRALELVKEIDSDDDLCMKYKQESCFTEEQKEKHLENIENFESWLINKIHK
jgi:hypothetical protein